MARTSRRERSRRNSRDDDREERSIRRSGERGSSGRKRGSKFEYRERDANKTKERATQTGRDFPSLLKDGIKNYNPQEGSHRIRVLPPTWEDPEHFGYDVWVNYGIGAEEHQYLSLSKNLGDDDPIAEEMQRAQREGDDEYAKQLKPTKRVGVWVVDRQKEDEGPKIWLMPWTFDRDLCAQAVDDEDGSVIPIDHPEEGFDISFRVEGKRLNKKYVGISVARRSSDLGRKGETWLEYIQENPIPDCLNFEDYDTLAAIFEGGGSRGSSSKEKDVDEEDDDKPRSRSKKKKTQRNDEWEIFDIEVDDKVVVVCEGEEFEGTCTEVKRKGFTLDDEESFEFDEIEEAELLD